MEYKINHELLTRPECNVMRGIAILGIVLHNFCHWLNPIVKENEFSFTQFNVDYLSAVMGNPNHLLPAHLLSFFGHYGVPLFLFLSAYGLERKYGQPLPGQPSPRPLPFVGYHFLKLFKMMMVGFVCFIIVDAITPRPRQFTLMQVIAQLGMFNNLLPHPEANIWPGPYWFFGLMFQLYIVYRLVLYRRHWAWTAGLMAVCLAVQLLLGPTGEAITYYRYNFMGAMIPFGCGLLFARFGERIVLLNLHVAALLMSAFVTTIFVWTMSRNYYSWAFVPAMVCYAGIYVTKTISHFKSAPVASILFRLLEWVGSISAALFVIHPVLRKIFIPMARRGDIYTGLLLYFIASIGAAWLINELLKKVPSPKMKS